MADNLVGFTPEFANLLRQAGVTLNFSDSMNKNLGKSWGSFSDKNIDKTSPFYKLLASGVKPGYSINSPQTVSAIENRKKQGIVSPDVQKLFDSITKMKNQEAARGAPDVSHHKGWFNKTLDIISRPGRAVTTGLFRDEQAVKDAQAQGKPAPGFFRFGEFAKGAKEGFLGRDSKTGIDLLKQQGVYNKAALFAGGLGIDVAADPLSYVGFGVGKKAAQQLGKVTGTSKIATETAAKIASGPTVNALTAPLPSKLAEDLGLNIAKSSKLLTPTEKAVAIKTGINSIDQIGSHLGAQAAKIAHEDLATNLTKVGMSAAKAKASAARWLNPKYSTKVLNPAVAKDAKELASRLPWLKLMEDSPLVANAPKLDKSRDIIYNEAKQSATKQLSEVLNANLEQQVKRSLTIKGLGLIGTLAPIPDTAVKALGSVAKVNMVGKTLKVFDKTFNTGSNFDRELAMTNSRAAGKAEQRINIAQKSLVNAFQGIDKPARKAWMNAFVGSPGLGKGVLKLADGSDASGYITDMMNHIGQYIDWTGKGAGIVSIKRINAYLPREYKLPSAGAMNFAGNHVVNFKKLFMTDAEHFKNIDPQNWLYHMHIAVEKSVARDQTMRAIAEFGVPLQAKVLTHDLATGKLVREGSAAARELVSKHGYGPIITKGTRTTGHEVDPSYHRYLDGLVFHPDIKQGLVKLVDTIDNYKHTEGIMRLYDKALGYFKKSVTLPSPTYHIRNSIGDLTTSYMDGVEGLRGAASYAQAAKVMKALNPISKQDEIRNILEAAPSKTGDLNNPLQEINKLLTSTGATSLSGRTVMKKTTRWKDVPGSNISAEQIWAAYNHTGLKRGFVATDLEHELRGNPNLPSKLVHQGMQKILDFSQSREDYFRLAHFIDRIKRSKAPSFEEAAKDAAHYVKKFHFDYSDVTETERLAFARVMPFYKFTRFATPLMTQIFFSSPGKILNAQKVLNDVSQAQGYSIDPGDFLPTADKLLPSYMQDLMMLPLMQSGANTSYFNPGLPETQIFSQTMGGESNSVGGTAKSILSNLAQSVTPAISTPAELYFGKRVLGGGQIPVQTKSGSYLPYVASKTPLTNTAYNKVPGDNGLQALLSFLSGLGITTNTPNKQKGELYRQKDAITRNRQKSGYKTPTNPPFYTSEVH